MPDRPTVPRSEAGFTLIEMLVSLSLLALAAVLIAQGLAFDRAFLTRSERRLSEEERVGAAQDLIRSRIERLSGQSRMEGRDHFIDLSGATDELVFLGPARRSTGGVGEPQRLYLTPAGDLRLDAGSVDAALLLSGVHRLELAYWGAVSGEKTPRWRSDWFRQPRPPELVRVRVGFDDPARLWPELVVRPTVTVDSACSFDVVLGDCRRRS